MVRQQDAPREPRPHHPAAPPSRGCPHPRGPQLAPITSAHIPLARTQSHGHAQLKECWDLQFLSWVGLSPIKTEGSVTIEKRRMDFIRQLDPVLYPRSKRKCKLKFEINLRAMTRKSSQWDAVKAGTLVRYIHH